MPISLPPDVAANIAESFGERGPRWLRELPQVVDRLCGTWDLEVVGDSFGGGTHSWVAPVRRSDGSAAVLKVPVVDEENVGEPAGLVAYDGDGAVRLYEFDSASGAMLLEWARPGTELLHQPGFPSLEGRPENVGKIESACAIYRRLRREPDVIPDGYPALPEAAGMVAEWVRLFHEPEPELAQVIPQSLRERAVQWCVELAVPDGPLLVVNRDTHLGNIVAAHREPWLLIDPKPYLGEAAFDAGFLVMIQVQSDPTAEHAHVVVERTAAALEISPERAQGWAFMRAMEEIAWALQDDEPEDLRLHSAVAQALSR
ncbi:aminoglycoside phosphotransferase family protein [Nocardia sp. NBC_00511]|uniref:aminoglycoside phosphotransferase family protein n=1 Tax=Nocardia sp. NBC_00511 TaxID=2903591 RepID=UPI0030E03533